MSQEMKQIDKILIIVIEYEISLKAVRLSSALSKSFANIS